MIAYKFLRPGAVGPFSGFAWPAPDHRTPGPWVAGRGAPEPCRAGVHGCLAADLPWWIHEELWIAEFDQPVTVAGRKVVSSRARLVRRVDGWDEQTSRTFAEACARRARDHAAEALDRAGDAASAGELRACETPQRVRDIARTLEPREAARISVIMAADGARRAITGSTATAAYIAAHAARQVGGATAMHAERRWQADWLALHLGLCEARA
jgi:mRNA-degrading endonuclease toxin of MazEF toxin-antitoxin module